MTVIDELLVLLDDGDERAIDDCTAALEGRTKQTLSSTLGRLIGRGWVKTNRDRKAGETRYQITQDGQAKVTRTLSHLKLSVEPHEGTWLVVVFNIAERQRKYRDILRNRLNQAGFGRVQNSLWATARDVEFELEDVLNSRHIRERVTVLRPQLSNADARELARSFEWDWKAPARAYDQFIELADQYLNDKRAHDNSLRARLLVYRYAKLLSQDPKFPYELEPRDYPRQLAHRRYESLRPFCYAK